MKIIKLISGILLLAIVDSCSTPYLIVSQHNLTGSPCGISTTGVNVRIRNKGKITFSKLTFKLSGRNLIFSGLKSGEITCYKNTPSIWTNNSCDIVFEKKGYTMTSIEQAVDHVGEAEIKHGYVTIDVIITKNNKGFNSETHLNIESE